MRASSGPARLASKAQTLVDEGAVGVDTALSADEHLTLYPYSKVCFLLAHPKHEMPLIFPTNWPSFVWGVGLAGIAAFGTGFLQKAGERAYAYIANKINPRPSETVQVDKRFVPTRYEPNKCAWVSEAKLYEYEQKGYTYYPYPKGNSRCFRITSDGRHQYKEFLLVQQGAAEITSA